MTASRRPQKPAAATAATTRKKAENARAKAAAAATRKKAADAWAADMAALAWGLAHPTRATILRFLLNRPPTLCGEIVDRLPLAQSTVSQHLKILRETGWVVAEEDGPRVHYSIVPQSLARLKKLVQGL
jgi:ArsR family transcriptional regulator, arsenate/arsenite/antimonite-responsive transcriptional repressor